MSSRGAWARATAAATFQDRDSASRAESVIPSPPKEFSDDVEHELCRARNWPCLEWRRAGTNRRFGCPGRDAGRDEMDIAGHLRPGGHGTDQPGRGPDQARAPHAAAKISARLPDPAAQP